VRCIAEVQDDVAYRRALRGDDHRCLREAVVRGLCHQHANMRQCAYSACADHALTQVDDRWFCRAHAKMWRVHNRIVERILAIPART